MEIQKQRNQTKRKTTAFLMTLGNKGSCPAYRPDLELQQTQLNFLTQVNLGKKMHVLIVTNYRENEAFVVVS